MSCNQMARHAFGPEGNDDVASHKPRNRDDVERTPLVTVVLAAFNGEAFLSEAIESVIDQTVSEWNLIIVDDGSTDRTSQLAEHFAARDSRISVLRRQNGGVASARNAGVEAAATKWIALLDQDDVFRRDKLERQLRFLEENPDVKCLGSWGVRIGRAGKQLGTFRVGPVTEADYNEKRTAGRLIYLLAASAVFDRELAMALGGFRSEPGGTDDIELWSRIADAHQVRALPEELVFYRVHAGSESASKLFVQRLNTERIKRNMRLRRAGDAEVSYEDFLERYYRLPWPKRFAKRWTAQSLSWYRLGGAMLADRNVLGLWFLFLSGLMRPALVVRRLYSQLSQRVGTA